MVLAWLWLLCLSVPQVSWALSPSFRSWPWRGGGQEEGPLAPRHLTFQEITLTTGAMWEAWAVAPAVVSEGQRLKYGTRPREVRQEEKPC